MRREQFVKGCCQFHILDFECHSRIDIYGFLAVDEFVLCLLFYGFQNVSQGDSTCVYGHFRVGCISGHAITEHQQNEQSPERQMPKAAQRYVWFSHY